MQSNAVGQRFSLFAWLRSGRVALRLAIGIVAVATGMSYSGAATEGDLEAARRSLRAAHDAVSAATLELRSLQSQNNVTQVEIADYRAYLERLRQVLDTSCRTVFTLKQNLGQPGGLSSEPGCDAGLPAPATPVAFPDEQTEIEFTASLDRELNASLSEFDELLLREMEAIKQRQSGSPDTASSGSGGGASGQGENGQGDASQGEAADSQGEGSATAASQSSDQQGEQSEAGNQQDQPGQVAARSPAGMDQQGTNDGGNRSGESSSTPSQRTDPMPPAQDDDIVARQLREAAENEPDPELREKLWDEYRRYKANQAPKSVTTPSGN